MASADGALVPAGSAGLVPGAPAGTTATADRPVPTVGSEAVMRMRHVVTQQANMPTTSTRTTEQAEVDFARRIYSHCRYDRVEERNGKGEVIHRQCRNPLCQKALDKGHALCNAHAEQAGIIPKSCLLYTSPSPRDKRQSRMPSSA